MYIAAGQHPQSAVICSRNVSPRALPYADTAQLIDPVPHRSSSGSWKATGPQLNCEPAPRARIPKAHAMPSGASAGLSSLPSSFSSSEYKSDSSSVNNHALLPQPSSAGAPRTADQVIELSVSSEELANWRRRHQQAQTGPMPWPGRTRSVLRRYSPLVPPAALLIALVVLLVQDLANAQSNPDSSDFPDNSSAPMLQWNSCALDNTIANVYNLSAECTTVMLPLCYDGICDNNDNATIAVSLKRIPAIGAIDNGVSAQTVWYLPDRRDFQTREETELQMTLLYEELRGDTDIYTLDLRGSGNSTALACNASDGSPLQTAIFTRNNGVLDPSDVWACANRLHKLGYTSLSAFSLSSASRDIEEVIRQFQPNSQAIVYAIGYGTLVAQRLMQRGVPQVIGYVFDGALGNPEGGTNSASLSGTKAIPYEVTKSDEDFGEVAADFLTWCQGDADCSKMFSDVSSITTLNATLIEVYTRLDADVTSMCSTILMEVETSGSSKSATTTPPSYILRQLLGLMMKDSTLWPFIPVVAYRFHRCGSEDLTLLTHFVNAIYAANDNIGTPELLFAIHAFSELWEEPSPDQTELTERFTDATISSGRVYTQLEGYCLFTGDTSDACINTSASLSSSLPVRTTLSYVETPTNSSANIIPSGTSVIFLSGGLDALSPPKYSASLFEAVQTENKALLIAPNCTHGVVQSALLSNSTACGRRVLASYVRSRGNLSSYDASCMTALSAPSLAISNSSSLLMLGVEDAYDSVLMVTVSSSRSGSNGNAGDLTNSGIFEMSMSSSGSTLDELSRRITALASSRHRYAIAFIVVASVLAVVVAVGAAHLIYRRRRRQQLAGEDAMLRCMRGDEDNELDLMRSIYLLSSSSPSSCERALSEQLV